MCNTVHVQSSFRRKGPATDLQQILLPIPLASLHDVLEASGGRLYYTNLHDKFGTLPKVMCVNTCLIDRMLIAANGNVDSRVTKAGHHMTRMLTTRNTTTDEV